MPRYFFDLENAVGHPDDRGTERPDDAQAKVQAIVFAGEYLSSNPGILNGSHRLAINVADARRRPIMIVEITSRESR